MDEEEYYAYIQIIATKTGENFEREIVPASSIRKFDYSVYKKDNNIFKDKTVKYKRSPNEKKVHCYILYAADTFEEVQRYVGNAKNKNKRFRVPKVNVSLIDTTNESSNSSKTLTPASDVESDIEDAVLVKKTKIERKKTKKRKIESRKNIEQSILNTYIYNSTDNSSKNFPDVNQLSSHDIKESLNEDHAPNTSNLNLLTDADATSTPVRELQIISNIEEIDKENDLTVACRAYKKQIDYFRKEAARWKDMYEKVKQNDRECNCKTMKAASNSSGYDQVFNSITNDVTNNVNGNNSASNEDPNIIMLPKGVKCNSTAYKSAYKTKKASEFITTMSIGIYGKEDLSKRCVRLQKDTQHLKVLSPIKTEVIEDQFYQFLKIKSFTQQQIHDELEKLNRYHHNAISCAKAKLEREKKLQQVNEVLDAMENAANQFKESNNILPKTAAERNTEIPIMNLIHALNTETTYTVSENAVQISPFASNSNTHTEL